MLYVDMDKYRISFNNIAIWLADELSHPATLFARKSWGVFSVYAHFAWPIVKECGIKIIIDLREDGIYTRMQNLCDKFGIEYFYYPVDKEVKHVKKMVTLFTKFCSLIDEGRFYMACAMGLHRTDIALCAYWVFYAAYKGIAPPAIRGYRKSDGHITDKIMRLLNAMYQEFTKRNGKKPIPQHIFNDRKKIIERQSAIS